MAIEDKHARRGGLADAFRIVWPLMLSHSVNAIMQFTDRIFLFRYSDAAKQAALPAGVLSFLLLCFMQATIGYSGTLVAQFHGAGRRLSCARSLSQSFWMLLVTVPVTLAMIPIGSHLLGLSGHAPEVIAQERTYFSLMTLGGTLHPLAASLAGYFSGRGFTKRVMWVTVAGSSLNILLDWAMIYGHCGLPEMGTAGAAWASNISFATVVAVFLFLALREPVFRGPRRRAAFAFDWKLTRKILRYGLPGGVQLLLDMSTFTLFVFIVGAFVDSLSFAASNACFTVNHLVFSPLLGISMGTSVLVGNYQGAKDHEAASRAFRSALAIGIAYVAAILLAVAFFFTPVVGLFIDDASVFSQTDFLALSRHLVTIMATWCFLDVIYCVVGGGLRGAGDTHFVMAALVGCQLLIWVPSVFAVVGKLPVLAAAFRPLASLVPWAARLSVVERLWLTIPGYNVLLAILLVTRWRRGRWREIDIVSR